MYSSARKVFQNFTTIKLLSNNSRTICALPNHLVNSTNNGNESSTKGSLLAKVNHNLYNIPKRMKTVKAAELKKNRLGRLRNEIQKHIEEAEDAEDDEKDDDEKFEKGTKVQSYKLGSLRVDLIATRGLGISRNKIQDAFYEGKIRLNGKKVPKKNIDIQEGDVIDFVKGTDLENPECLSVSRVTIMSWKLVNEGYDIKMMKEKHLIIANYKDRFQN